MVKKASFLPPTFITLATPLNSMTALRPEISASSGNIEDWLQINFNTNTTIGQLGIFQGRDPNQAKVYN